MLFSLPRHPLRHHHQLPDPAKGDFTAYAATAIRNPLRDLYERQLRPPRHHVYALSLTEIQAARRHLDGLARAAPATMDECRRKKLHHSDPGELRLWFSAVQWLSLSTLPKPAHSRSP
ncbi:MAG: hypothetical protein K9N23_01945 [Akkermansiaceae bacterium]|nr:hypothetical protein [Akkermansiaceae bacterium]